MHADQREHSERRAPYPVSPHRRCRYVLRAHAHARTLPLTYARCPMRPGVAAHTRSAHQRMRDALARVCVSCFGRPGQQFARRIHIIYTLAASAIAASSSSSVAYKCSCRDNAHSIECCSYICGGWGEPLKRWWLVVVSAVKCLCVRQQHHQLAIS